MKDRLEILVLVKKFGEYAKHQPKIDMLKTLENYADVFYWHEDGHINTILTTLNITPDFIFHYDIAWNNGLSPKIEGLGDIDIATGCFVIDLHWDPEKRIKYFEENKIDLIFSVTKHPFLNVFPEYNKMFRWLPWSINPHVMRDYNLTKDINTLLMGLVFVDENNRGKHELPKQMPEKGRYAFRDAVFNKIKDRDDFVFYPHPGHRVKQTDRIIVNESYAKMLNRSKIFLTCGSRNKTGGIAVQKFFEAPACHTLLLAEPNKDIDDLGFIDGENYVACTVDNVLNMINYYLANEKERKRISKNGYDFIHKHHTNDERIKQMIYDINHFLTPDS